jgi:malonyl-CoA/methylmalonyl-CoA synthetase
MHDSLLGRVMFPLRADAVAVQDSQGEHTFAAVRDGAAKVCAALLEAGLLPQERVAVLADPSFALVACLFGVLQAGGVALILSPGHPLTESSYVCQDAGALRVLIGDPALRSKAPSGLTVHMAPDIFSVAAASSRPVRLPLASDPALQLYTSGTTAKPKGAVLSHENLWVQQREVARAWEVTPSDALLHGLPLHHMHGLAIAFFTVFGAGARTVFLPKFDADTVWRRLGEATMFMGVPTMYGKLLEAFARAETSDQALFRKHAQGLRLATSGSAALPVKLARKWQAIAGDIPLERFGMTEIGVGLSNPLRGPRIAGSVGTPLATVETRVLTADGQPASEGELHIAGPSVFLGYHNRAEANREAFVEEAGARWFRTGDTVRVDDDGVYRILGRTSIDILKSGGYKLSALEIEEAIREHPKVAEVAVIGLHDEQWGQVVVACVVLRGAESSATSEGLASSLSEEAPLSEAFVFELRQLLTQRLATYKCPRRWIGLTALPKNHLGKVQKAQLLSRFAIRG